MKTNKKRSKLSLKKMQVAKINNPSLIRGGGTINRAFWPLSSSDYPTCTKNCIEVQHVGSDGC
ncbi:hypothetical protein [Aquimarina sp. 2201CG5-10]|uniref:hypothetical protein n=1 Tax=Aquimarina callyspongiae TaxID=3098150 RepID=UPI002AB4B78D|nr:hypothetical protein [Aquimarina sp. 2201CG5-10]MDY8137809.1 hypothetical protein [Aquimarina sp. 2201CG5-10]